MELVQKDIFINGRRAGAEEGPGRVTAATWAEVYRFFEGIGARPADGAAKSEGQDGFYITGKPAIVAIRTGGRGRRQEAMP